jgi:hypothetical protein
VYEIEEAVQIGVGRAASVMGMEMLLLAVALFRVTLAVTKAVYVGTVPFPLNPGLMVS